MERLLLECAVRSTLIAAVAAAVLCLVRTKNVVARHGIWTSVLVFMLALPLLVAYGPKLPLSVLPSVPQNAERGAPPSAGTFLFLLPQMQQALQGAARGAAESGRLAWSQWIESVYILGVAVLLLRLVTGMIEAYRIQRRARLVDGYLTSACCSSPISVGWVHGVTILPEGWQDWKPSKLDAVLTHEKEHVRRHDPFVQWLALVNRAVFWFHPLAWWLERQLAELSEEACDIAVLERGHDAGAYSEYLLDMARSVKDSRYRVRVLGMAMPGRYLSRRIQKLWSGAAPSVSVFRMAVATAVFFLLSVGLSTAILVRAQSMKTTGIGAEIMVQPPGSSLFLAPERAMPLQIGDRLRQLSGVKAVAPVMVRVNMEVGEAIEVIYGIDSHFTDVTGGFHWREGGIFRGQDEIIVDDIWAASHSLKPGDTTTILDHQFKVSGVVDHGQGARVFMSMDSLSNVVSRDGGANLFFVKLEDPDQIKTVFSEIDQLLPGYTIRNLNDYLSLTSR